MLRCSRRSGIKAAFAAAMGASLAHPGLARGAESRPAKGRPRYFLLILASGGIDAVFTTNPASRGEVEPWIDVPYRSNDIVAAGGLQLGPHLAPLKSVASGFAFVNGVQVQTANHVTGWAQFARLKTRVEDGMPNILDLIGRHRDSQACASMDSGAWIGRNLFHTGASAGLFSYVESASPEDMAVMRHALAKQAERLKAASPATAESLRQTAAVFDRLPHIPRFQEERWSEVEEAQSVGRALQRVLWAFQNDLTCTFGMSVFGAPNPWDSHSWNSVRQTQYSSWTMPMVERFVRALASTSNEHGPLSDTTALVMGSELGRFPRLNGADGKDHFPEVPFLFYGPAFRTNAAYGGTDRKMMGLPVLAEDGTPRGKRTHLLLLDDIGTTLLHLGGVVDPGPSTDTADGTPFSV